MLIEDFEYSLPEELIAQQPSARRDASRLMRVTRATGSIEHFRFVDLPVLLAEDDLLILNDSRVFPARLLGRLATGGRIEILLLKEESPLRWEALGRPGRKMRPGTRLLFPGMSAQVESASEGRILIRFECKGDLWSWIEEHGQAPLPPYIRRPRRRSTPGDRQRYQTVFARERGSVAAPTAGLHFTPDLLSQIPHEFVTLHVGYGTFSPVQSEQVEDHRMASETFEISESSARRIARHHHQGKRIVAVGSTSTRVLEHVWQKEGTIRAGRGSTDLFIYPGFDFRVVGGMVTNFHLPRSSLILLVSAFASRELILEAYEKAIESRYRFYSYGDAMLIV